MSAGSSSSSVRSTGGAANEPAGPSAEDDKQEGKAIDVDEELEGEGCDEGGGEEMQKPKTPSAVSSPSEAEVEDHLLTVCADYGSWCPHCIASQSRGNPYRASGEESEFPRLSFDCGFISREKGAVPMMWAQTRKANQLRRHMWHCSLSEELGI